MKKKKTNGQPFVHRTYMLNHIWFSELQKLEHTIVNKAASVKRPIKIKAIRSQLSQRFDNRFQHDTYIEAAVSC